MEETMMMNEAVETTNVTAPVMEAPAEPAVEPTTVVTAADPLPATTPAWHDLLLVGEGAVVGVVGWEFGKWLGRKISEKLLERRRARKARKEQKEQKEQESTEETEQK